MTSEFRKWSNDVIHCRRKLFLDKRDAEELRELLYDRYANIANATVLGAAEYLGTVTVPSDAVS